MGLVNQVLLSAFSDELSKIAASSGLAHVSKGRIGSRPISAAKLLAKDKDGSLYKKKHALAASDLTAAGLGAGALAGGLAGYEKGKDTGQGISGAARGAFGAGGGGFQGMMMGAGAGAFAPMIPGLKKLPTGVLKAAPLIGGALGGLAGYKLLTHGVGKKKLGDAAGAPQDVRGDSKDDPGSADLPKRAGEVPSEGKGNIPTSEKTGSLQGANTQTSPVMSGEDLRGAVANKARQRGDTPTQDVAADQPNGRIEPHAKSITFDQSAKPVKRGDTPTLNNDMNKIDRFDGRGEATTITGLAQNSNNVGAFNSPAEHT